MQLLPGERRSEERAVLGILRYGPCFRHAKSGNSIGCGGSYAGEHWHLGTGFITNGRGPEMGGHSRDGGELSRSKP
jgi:hypothetical protein